MTEQEIFERICKGDEKTLEFLYKKYYRMMTKMVITNSGTEEEARDIYQDALIVFWQKATSGKLVMTSKISTYIYSINHPFIGELIFALRFTDCSILHNIRIVVCIV